MVFLRRPFGFLREFSSTLLSAFLIDCADQSILQMKYALILQIILFSSINLMAQDSFLTSDPVSGTLSLTTEGAEHLASLAFRCIDQEYPNKIAHVMSNEEEVGTPQELHPAFYGCFDWHSSIHGHWMLVRLMKEFPEMESDAIRSKLSANLTAENIQAEVAYLEHPQRKSFERMYGWAWLLKLAEELHTWDDPEAQTWSENLQPLADKIISLYIDFLPRQTYPIRTGQHPNTAFGLSFAWDYAVTTDHEPLQTSIREAALRYYGLDTECPAHYEPGGADFLSPCLEEANLMVRILSEDAFSDWFGRFMPDISDNLQVPAVVSDRSDGKLVHLDGLNLSRAWCLYRISAGLPEGDPRRTALQHIAQVHIQVTMPEIASGGYEGEHWLASFAVYALTVAGK